MSRFGTFFRHYFNLDEDGADEQSAIESIKKGIAFRGVNLWTLAFAIIIASVGLNVNSTAVIIGAMLISPLMGPIMGVGLGIGIDDFDLVRRGLLNLLTAVIISIAVSTLYFLLTPLHNPTSELLARTTPTLWDVFIAFAGGLAGIVGATRKEKSNVIPGVAIATALMPPLCTAGFGLATGHWYYFLGALYLFFINSVFICIATILIVRFLRFHRREFESEARRKKTSRYMLLVVVVTVAPSVWIGYRMVQKSVFENSAEQFVRREFKFTATQVITKNFVYDSRHPKIDLLLIGRTLDSAQTTTLRRRLAKYGLDSARLVLRQGLDARQEIDFAQVKASILDEVFKDRDSTTIVATLPAPEALSLPDLKPDIAALFPQIAAYSLTKTTLIRTDTLRRSDSIVVMIANTRAALGSTDQKRLRLWLKARMSPDSVQLIIQPVRQ